MLTSGEKCQMCRRESVKSTFLPLQSRREETLLVSFDLDREPSLGVFRRIYQKAISIIDISTLFENISVLIFVR